MMRHRLLTSEFYEFLVGAKSDILHGPSRYTIIVYTATVWSQGLFTTQTRRRLGVIGAELCFCLLCERYGIKHTTPQVELAGCRPGKPISRRPRRRVKDPVFAEEPPLRALAGRSPHAQAWVATRIASLLKKSGPDSVGPDLRKGIEQIPQLDLPEREILGDFRRHDDIARRSLIARGLPPSSPAQVGTEYIARDHRVLQISQMILQPPRPLDEGIAAGPRAR